MRRQKVVAVTLYTLFAAVFTARPQDSCSSVRITVSARLETIGMPRQIGEMVRYDKEGNELLGDDITYHYQTEPIKLPTETTTRFGGEVLWTAFPEDRIAFGARFAHLNAIGRVTGEVHSGDMFTWVKLWESNIFPLINIDAPGSLSRISYHGRDRFALSYGDVFLAKKILQGATDLSVSLGVRLLSPRYRLTVGETQHVRAITGIGYWSSYFDNNVTLEATTQSRYSLCAGPSVGATVSHRFWVFRLDAGLNQSFTFGQVVHDGRFIDIDDVTVSGWHSDTYQYIGSASFAVKEAAWIPATDLTLGIRYALDRHLHLGISGFYSVFSNLSYGPTFAAPWDINNNKAPRGHEWSVTLEPLRLYGVTLSLGIVL